MRCSPTCIHQLVFSIVLCSNWRWSPRCSSHAPPSPTASASQCCGTTLRCGQTFWSWGISASVLHNYLVCKCFKVAVLWNHPEVWADIQAIRYAGSSYGARAKGAKAGSDILYYQSVMHPGVRADFGFTIACYQ